MAKKQAARGTIDTGRGSPTGDEIQASRNIIRNARPPVDRMGGSFAPPLPPDKVKQYRKLADKAPLHIRDVMHQLCDMVLKFYQTPPSKAPGRPHPVGIGEIVPLEQAEVERMWDLVPWDGQELEGGMKAPAECATYQEMFDQLEKEATIRNSQRIDTWMLAMQEKVLNAYYDDGGKFYRQLIRAIQEGQAWLEVISPEERKRIDKEMAKARECRQEMNDCMAGKECEGLPYPALETTELRDAAFHLVWFAKELSGDREPATNDKLDLTRLNAARAARMAKAKHKAKSAK